MIEAIRPHAHKHEAKYEKDIGKILTFVCNSGVISDAWQMPTGTHDPE
jgi:hypothetical protein